MESCYISILVLGGGLQGVSVAYSLYRIGYLVYVYSKESAFEHSKWVKEAVSFELSVDNICSYISEKKIAVIIPMSDNYAVWLSENKNLIQEQTEAKCAVSDYNSILLASSKSDLMNLCQENHIPVPRTAKLNKNNIDRVGNFVGFPALIKPDHSVGARGIKRVDNVSELRNQIQLIIDKYGTASLQEFVDNPDFYFNVMLYRYADGSFSQSVMIKIHRFYPINGGSSCFCETIEDAELLMMCKKVLNLLNWKGFADFDILFDKSDHQYKIIEMNPRLPASIRAADIAGINFPQIIVCDNLEYPCPLMKYKTGVFLRYLGLDIMWFFKSKKRFNTTYSWFNFIGKNIFYQDFYRSDMKLSLFLLKEGICKLFRNR